MLIRVCTFRMHFRLRFIQDKRLAKKKKRKKPKRKSIKMNTNWNLLHCKPEKCFVHIHEIPAFIYLWFAAHVRNHYFDFDEVRMRVKSHNTFWFVHLKGHNDICGWIKMRWGATNFTNWARNENKKQKTTLKFFVVWPRSGIWPARFVWIFYSFYFRKSNTKIATSMRYKMRFTAMKIAYKLVNISFFFASCICFVRVIIIK